MAKNVYLLITDTHFGNLVTSTRKAYREEMQDTQSKLLEIAVKYKKAGNNVIACFMGDIFHNSYKDVTEALIDKDFLHLWQQTLGDIYTVMGNHEFTYYKANPFYTAVNCIESDAVRGIINKVWMPLGIDSVIKVVDRLEDGEVVFHFNHYGTGIRNPEIEKINIGLFHQDIIDPVIRESAKGNLNYVQTVDVDKSGILTGYQYCFFGHIHNVYGVWKSNGVYLQYLASLGRTNETEVRNDFLERDIPAIIVEDGKFVGIEDNYVQLLPREKCIVEEVVIKNQEARQRVKEVRELKDYIPFGDNPVDNVKQIFTETPTVLQIINDLQTSENDNIYTEICRKMRDLRIGY